MEHLDPQTTLAFVVAVWLMVWAGMGKRQIKLRHHPVCHQCGLRHAPGRCLRQS
jgi:hypothetical protein